MNLRQNKASSSRVPKNAYYRGSTSSKKPKPAPRKPHSASIVKTVLNSFLIIGLVVIVGYDLLLKPSPNLNINSTAYHPLSVYQTEADKLSRSPLNRNKLTYNQAKIINSLKVDFPEINRATTRVPVIGQQPTININIAKPLFILASANNKFIVNQAGVIVASDKVNTSNLTPLNDKSGIEIKGGVRLLSGDAVGFIEQILAQAKSAKVKVISLTLPAQAQELDIYTKDASYYTKFYFGSDPLLQAGQWLAARHQFQQKNITPSQYLDARIAGKIYYK